MQTFTDKMRAGYKSMPDLNTPQWMIDEYLAKGGKITYCPFDAHTPGYEKIFSLFPNRDRNKDQTKSINKTS
jgi:hypothetical protein